MPCVTVGPAEAEREADREHAVAEPELRRASERHGHEIGQLDADDREVALGRGADHLRRAPAACDARR